MTIYTVFAGLNFPDSVTKLAEELAELERRVEERNQKTDTIAVALAGFKSHVKKEEVNLEALLSEEELAPAQEREVPKDPFDFLNDLK